MAPETKLGYGWLDRRLKLRRQRDALRLPTEQIMAAYRIEDAADIRRELGELALAEDYLATYWGDSSRYTAIADAGPLLIGSQEQLSRLSGPDKAFWRLAGFAMIHGRDKRKGNDPHRLFPFVDPVPADLPASSPSRIAHRLGIIPAGDDPAQGGRLAATEAALRDRQRSAATARLIAATLDELRLEHEERSAPERAIRKVRQTGNLIARLEPAGLSANQRSRLRGDLAALQAHAGFLLGQLEGRADKDRGGQMAQKPAVPRSWTYPKAIIRPPYSKVPWRILRRLGWPKPRSGPSKPGAVAATPEDAPLQSVKR